MIEVRWHGRGGQGAVTSVELLAVSAIAAGKYAQGFPSFGPERRGAPVAAFTRIDDKKINVRSGIYEPDVVLVLDDYHTIDAPAIDLALSFLLDHMPPHLHLIVSTREDPQLPLARMRARGQLTELRAADLRFTPSEAAEFLNPVMGLSLSAADIAALEDRTEGWIAGLQLAAISMQGLDDAAGFVQSFTGSHRFVMDYLVDEVLLQQPEAIQHGIQRLCESRVEHAHHLVGDRRRVCQRAQDIEDGAYAQRAARPHRGRHRRLELGREQEADAHLVDALGHKLGRQNDLDAESL